MRARPRQCSRTARIPGSFRIFVKQALLNVAARHRRRRRQSRSRAADWGDLARRLGVKVIHIAERDTQVSSIPKEPGEFVNTWSVDGFVSEGAQPSRARLGHARAQLPARRQASRLRLHGCHLSDAAWRRPRACARGRRNAGHFHGFLITHGEAISISDYYTVRDGAQVVYRPTCHYAYHPSDSAVLSVHEFAGRNFVLQDRKRILMDEITKGIDELGVLLAGHKKNAYWFGSQLSIDEARKLAPYHNATSLQVTVSCLSGMVWAMENPNCGVVEPDEIDFRRNLEICHAVPRAR